MRLRLYQRGITQAQDLPVKKVTKPIAQPDIRGQWAVPTLTAVTFGLIVGALAAFFSRRDMVDPSEIFVGTFLVATTISFVLMILRAWGALNTIAEFVTQKDLNQDGHYPTWPRPILNRRLTRPDAPAVQPDRQGPALGQGANRLPIRKGESVLHWFVRHAGAAGTSFEHFTGKLPRTIYNGYRNQLIQEGWADWNSYKPDGAPNVTQGWSLTAGQDEVLENIGTLED